MKTKLSLKVDRDTLQRAKDYADKKSESLSSMVEGFLKDLANKKFNHSAVDASKGLLKKKFVSLNNIRAHHYKDKFGV